MIRTDRQQTRYCWSSQISLYISNIVLYIIWLDIIHFRTCISVGFSLGHHFFFSPSYSLFPPLRDIQTVIYFRSQFGFGNVRPLYAFMSKSVNIPVRDAVKQRGEPANPPPDGLVGKKQSRNRRKHFFFFLTAVDIKYQNSSFSNNNNIMTILYMYGRQIIFRTTHARLEDVTVI